MTGGAAPKRKGSTIELVTERDWQQTITDTFSSPDGTSTTMPAPDGEKAPAASMGGPGPGEMSVAETTTPGGAGRVDDVRPAK